MSVPTVHGETEKGFNLDELQQETEKLLGLLKDRQPGMMTWNMFMHERLQSMQTLISEALGKKKEQHELTHFQVCTFGDGGFYYHDGADRAVCSCGWKSVAVQRDKQLLIALWKAHREVATLVVG